MTPTLRLKLIQIFTREVLKPSASSSCAGSNLKKEAGCKTPAGAVASVCASSESLELGDKLNNALCSVAQEAEQLPTHRRTAHVCVTSKSLDRHQVGNLVRRGITAWVIPVNPDGGRHLTLKRLQQHLRGSAWRSGYQPATTQMQVLTHGGQPERQGRWARPHQRSMQGCYLWRGNSAASTRPTGNEPAHVGSCHSGGGESVPFMDWWWRWRGTYHTPPAARATAATRKL